MIINKDKTQGELLMGELWTILTGEKTVKQIISLVKQIHLETVRSQILSIFKDFATKDEWAKMDLTASRKARKILIEFRTPEVIQHLLKLINHAPGYKSEEEFPAQMEALTKGLRQIDLCPDLVETLVSLAGTMIFFSNSTQTVWLNYSAAFILKDKIKKELEKEKLKLSTENVIDFCKTYLGQERWEKIFQQAWWIQPDLGNLMKRLGDCDRWVIESVKDKKNLL